MTTHQVCSNSHTKGEIVELPFPPEYLISPSFYAHATISNKHDLQVLSPPNRLGTYKVRNEIETKRNETKRNEINKNETKRNEINETKRNQRNENEMKRNQRKQNEIN